MKINWKVRLKSKPFILALVSLVTLFAQQVAAVFGVDLSPVIESLRAPFNTLLGIFILLGIVVDATTPGVVDSDRAMENK